jgi:hypothetical protein
MLLAVYGCSLLLTYHYVVAPRWSYLGYTSVRPLTPTIVVGVGLACVLLGTTVPTADLGPRNLLRVLGLLVVVVPTISVGTMVTPSLSLNWVVFAVALTVGLVLSTTSAGPRPITLTEQLAVLGGGTSRRVLLLLGGLSIAVLVASFGFSNPVDLITDPLGEVVYETRYASRSRITPGSIGNSVLFSSTRVLFPALIGVGIYRSDRSMTWCGLAGQVTAFGLTAHKTPIVWAVVCLLIGRMGRIDAVRPRRMVLLAVAGVWVGALLAIEGVYWAVSVLARRTFSAQAVNAAYYFDFFSQHEKAQLRHSFLAFTGEFPYDLSKPGFVIGEIYYGDERISANASAWVDGYANFGMIGIVLVAVLVAGYLWLLESSAVYVPGGVTLMVMLPLTLGLCNTSVFTLMTTHGGIVAPVVLLLVSQVVRADLQQEEERSSAAAAEHRRRHRLAVRI